MTGTAIEDAFYSMSDEFKTATSDWVPVVSIDDGGGYDWQDFHGWYSPSARRYFWGGASGCSCNSFSDSFYNVSDFENGDRPALMAGMRRWVEESYGLSPVVLVDALTTVNSFDARNHTDGSGA